MVGYEELYEILAAMYRGTVSKVRDDHKYSKELGVQVGVHSGSVLSPSFSSLSFRLFKTGSLWELLCADGFPLITGSISELGKRFQMYEQNLESKDIKVNLVKTSKKMHRY